MTDYVVLAILARDKEFTLPLYLDCIERQDYPKEAIYLYIRTNNNSDRTEEILKAWIEKVKGKYAGIEYIDDPLENPGDSGTWTVNRFQLLADIRQKSIDYAKEKKAHYFVVDCDNFILPYTLTQMLKTNLPVVGPMLPYQGQRYANYHTKTNKDGYYEETEHHDRILSRIYTGLLLVDVVHCTYLIRSDVLQNVVYDDGSGRHEYVIFSDWMRRQNIEQYLDNRYVYGQLTLARTMEEFSKTAWVAEEFIDRIKVVYTE